MRAVGLITEYNPFHNGHLHHLRESRRVTGAEVAVAVMSGHFLQRGEPAIVDKWRRTQMALAAGVDVVVELPFAFACRSAPHFALGAVQCLNGLGGIETLCFGSEAGELKPLQCCAEWLRNHRAALDAVTAAGLRQGRHYAEARADLVAERSGDPSLSQLLRSPNNILGLEYLQALHASDSPLQPFTFPRLGAAYHAVAADSGIASATGIRHRLARGQSFAEFLPEAAAELLRQALQQRLTVDPNLLHRLLLGQIFRGRDAMQGVCQVEQGLDRRLVEAALESRGWDDLVQRSKVRHLTRTRLQRVLCYVLNDVPGTTISEASASGPLYLHLLGCSERGRRFLAATRKQRRLPLIGNFSRVHAILKRFHGPNSQRHRQSLAMLDLDLRATRIYTLLLPGWTGGNRNRDFFQEVISSGSCFE